MKLTRKEQKKQTREKLLNTAFEVFSENGLLDTTTADVAKAAGVSHGSLFLHFPSREQLIAAVVEEFGMQLGEELITAMSGRSLRCVLEAHLSVLQKWEAFYRELVVCGPHLTEELGVVFANIQSGVGYSISCAIAGKEEAAPNPLVLNTWLGLVHYYLTHRDLFVPSGSVLKAKGDDLINFYVELIQGRNHDKM